MTTQRTLSMLTLATLLVFLIPGSGLAIDAYNQDFEGLVQSDLNALTNDGWLVYGNVFSANEDYLYGYGPYGAPNDGAAFCQIDMGQGGDEQGEQQLVVFSDYNNGDHGVGNIIETNVFQEQTVGPDDIGSVWKFEFQAKRGNLEGNSTAKAFLKTLDPSSGYAITNFISADMTTIPDTWGGYTLTIEIDPSLEGQLIQFGFMNTAMMYQGSGIFYDNLVFYMDDTSAVPADLASMGMTLDQNFPNPFNPRTQINFALENTGAVELTVYDIAGRRVATLQQGILAAGDHHVTWDGTTEAGTPAPTGRYSYLLKTASGQVARSMILLK